MLARCRSAGHARGRRGSNRATAPGLPSAARQRMPAGLPCGMPGMGEEIEGAMQQAAAGAAVHQSAARWGWRRPPGEDGVDAGSTARPRRR